MLIAFGTQHSIKFFRLNILKNFIQLIYFLLKPTSFSLYVLYFLRNEHSRVSKMRLLQLSILNFRLNSATGGLQMQKMLSQLCILVILHEIYL